MNATVIIASLAIVAGIVGGVVFVALRNQNARNVLIGELAKLAAQIESVERERLAKTSAKLTEERTALAHASPEELQAELNRRRLPP